MEYNSTFKLFDTMTLNKRHVWLHIIESPIGDIYTVQYEKPHMELETKLFYNDFTKAEAYYKRICKKMVDGKI